MENLSFESDKVNTNQDSFCKEKCQALVIKKFLSSMMNLKSSKKIDSPLPV